LGVFNASYIPLLFIDSFAKLFRVGYHYYRFLDGSLWTIEICLIMACRKEISKFRPAVFVQTLKVDYANIRIRHYSALLLTTLNYLEQRGKE